MVRATRRGFLLGLGALIAAPAVVKVSSIMPVRVPFDQRMVWSVYGAEGARLNAYVSALRAPTANSDINASYPFAEWPAAAPHVRLDRGEPLTGVELQRYEAMDLPRVELLRVGDRVVDKRIIGGPLAQVMPRSVARMDHSDGLAEIAGEYQTDFGDRIQVGGDFACTDGQVYAWDDGGVAKNAGYLPSLPEIQPPRPWPDRAPNLLAQLDGRCPSRAEIEARHQRSTRARRQAADVLARHAQWVGGETS